MYMCYVKLPEISIWNGSKIFQTPPTPGLATLQALALLLGTVTEIMTLRHRK